MPVFDIDPQKVEEKPAIPKVTKPYYRSSVVDTQYTNRKSLLTNIQGYPWKINYFSQVVGKNDNLSGLQEDRVAARQQYIEIRDMTIKVISPNSTDQEQEIKILNINGSAYVINDVIPNTGDQFIADIGDGREGIFEVLTSEKMSHLKDAVYRIDYRLKNYMSPSFDFQLDLKVIKTLYEYKDEMRYGLQTVIEEGEFNRLRNYDKVYQELLRRYMEKFWSNEFHTLLVPGQPDTSIYDHFLTTFVTKLFDIHNAPHFNKLRVLNVSDDYNVMTCDTVLDAIIKRDPAILKTGIRKAGVAYTRSFKFHPIFNSITYTGIRYIIYPSDGTKKIDYQIKDHTRKNEIFENANVPLREDSLEDVFGDSVMLPGFPHDTSPLIKPVLKDDFYIFSEAFYKQSSDLSAFEYLVLAFIKGQSPNYNVLDMILEQRSKWQVLEEYYYTPILLMMIYAYSRSV
ncbi:MAG: hypothetical protein M0R77_01125 [Gammaproteobacteria bacterium]|nr:hypothetical protein [Acholeplasmataceae bacterium]MCK9529158.1 hypothetical protein [Gammaproteobacteria bacterium]